MGGTDKGGAESPFMDYKLLRVGTGTGVGWFACRPAKEAAFETSLAYAQAHPLDTFFSQAPAGPNAGDGIRQVSSLLKRGLQGDDHRLGDTHRGHHQPLCHRAPVGPLH